MLNSRCLLIVTVLLFSGGSAAKAQCGGWGYGGYGGFGGGYIGPAWWQQNINSRTPPYFAMYPPVYYSGEITRIPYGASPWAALPYRHSTEHVRTMTAPTSTPSMEAPAPQIIENPHYKPSNKAQRTSNTTRQTAYSESAGEFIRNPFYQPANQVARD